MKSNEHPVETIITSDDDDYENKKLEIITKLHIFEKHNIDIYKICDLDSNFKFHEKNNESTLLFEGSWTEIIYELYK